MAQRELDTIPVRSVGHIIKRGDSEEVGQVRCPTFMQGDDTAFAVYISDGSLYPVLRPNALVFFSKLRSVGIGDIIYVHLKCSRKFIRVLRGIGNDTVTVCHNVGGDFEDARFECETIDLDDVAEIAVCMGSRRYSI